jgi:hypothetical protein
MFIPNARVSILRGIFQDSFGDTHDSLQPVAVNVPASLVNMSSTVTSPETGRSTDVELMQGIVRGTVDIQKGDRILDQKTKLIYTVDGVTQSGVFMRADKKLKMRLFT